MAEQWSPWAAHDGRGYPAPPGTEFQAEFDAGLCGFVSGGQIGQDGGHSWYWVHICGKARPTRGYYAPILRYRLRRPPAIQRLVDLVETLPVREREDA